MPGRQLPSDGGSPWLDGPPRPRLRRNDRRRQRPAGQHGRSGQHRRSLRTGAPCRAVPRLPPRPAANAHAFQGPFYFTGDKAAIDEDGYFWFEGRDDDVITSSAYRIGPFEVESVLVEHPAVIEAAVVGKDDPERTQIVTAFCILAPARTGSPELAHELQEFVKHGTAPYKYPREIHFVEELPKTISGKIRRSELRGSAARPDKTTARRSVSQVHHPPEIP